MNETGHWLMTITGHRRRLLEDGTHTDWEPHTFAQHVHTLPDLVAQTEHWRAQRCTVSVEVLVQPVTENLAMEESDEPHVMAAAPVGKGPVEEPTGAPFEAIAPEHRLSEEYRP